MNKPRALFTVAIDGRIAWRERTACQRVCLIGKKTAISIPQDVVTEVLASGQKLRVAVTFDAVYDTPTYETLHAVRRAMLALAPPDLRPIFEEARRMHTWEEWQTYQQRLIDVAMERAQVVDTGWNGDRARCPFCGDWPASGLSEGFTYPNGLAMHLEGRGNARQCDVMRALMDWGRDRL